MRINSALVVDEIRENEADGRVDLIGLREDLYFDDLPVLLERLTLFIDLSLDRSDLGQKHEFELRIVDPDETVLKAIPVRFTLPADYPRPTAPLDPSLFEIPFQQFGRHHVEIVFPDFVARRLPLHIMPRDEPLDR